MRFWDFTIFEIEVLKISDFFFNIWDFTTFWHSRTPLLAFPGSHYYVRLENQEFPLMLPLFTGP